MRIEKISVYRGNSDMLFLDALLKHNSILNINRMVMKLVNISKSGENYLIKALHSFKLFGLIFYSKVKTYKLSKDEEHWYLMDSKEEVSVREKTKLNKWLKDHQKFIEKA